MTEEFDAELLTEFLREAKGNIEEAAKLAEMPMSEFRRLMIEYGISLKYTGEIGDCFMSGGRLLLQLHIRGIKDAVLVHGLPVLNRPPFSEYTHGWIELNGFCIDTEAKICCEKSLYYESGRIDPKSCVKYSADDILKEVNSSGHWGPWDERFQDKE
jgi:hypothetical protein